MELITKWKNATFEKAPYIFPEDQEFLQTEKSRNATVVWSSWLDAYRHDRFGEPDDTRIHLGLLPLPYAGDLSKASVFLLSLNPGLGALDYYGENKIPEYRRVLIQNLRQNLSDKDYPFIFLNSKFAWLGGFTWWHSKLARVIKDLASYWNISFAHAREQLSRRIANIELFPYHSMSFRDADHWLRNLPSVKYAREFVHKIIFPKVRSGHAIIIVTRQVRMWNIPEIDGVIQYTAGEARGAHFTPNSRGGQAILEFLK